MDYRSCRILSFSLLLLGFWAPLQGEVTRVEILSRETLPQTSPPYERIVGVLHFEIDPKDPRHAVVADLDKAPLTARGTVAFSSDFRLHRPLNLSEEGAFAWVDVPNRGGPSRLSPVAARHQWVLFEVGWEFDVPAQANRLGIRVPIAREADGSPIEGQVEAVFVLEQAKAAHELSELEVYPPVNAANAANGRNQLKIREAAHLPGGEVVPRDRWRLEGNRLFLEGGFQPGRVYELSWLAQDPPLGGLGFVATRDAVSWLKHGEDSLAPVTYACAHGSSQTGRYLRSFLYHGFNTDVHGRAVLDGAIPHVAGSGHLDLNRRWATPRETALFRTARYPFADRALPDPVTGEQEGLLENPRVEHRPKLFYTNSSAEYWGAGRLAGLLHTDPATGEDVPPLETVRLYTFAGAQHGPGSFPPPEPPSGVGVYTTNPVNFSPVVEALRVAMYEWVVEGRTPPDSAYPRVSEGTLVQAKDLAFPNIPGVSSPRALPGGLRNANPLLPDGAGVGHELPLWVPQVGEDGNELGGIRLPEVEVPLATCTGWLFRSPELGAPHELRPVLRGSWIPFAKTREEAQAIRDPRPAVLERYPSREAYLTQIRKATETLVARRLLLPEHLDSFLESAAQRWDWWMGAPN